MTRGWAASSGRGEVCALKRKPWFVRCQALRRGFVSRREDGESHPGVEQPIVTGIDHQIPRIDRLCRLVAEQVARLRVRGRCSVTTSPAARSAGRSRLHPALSVVDLVHGHRVTSPRRRASRLPSLRRVAGDFSIPDPVARWGADGVCASPSGCAPAFGAPSRRAAPPRGVPVFPATCVPAGADGDPAPCASGAPPEGRCCLRNDAVRATARIAIMTVRLASAGIL